jgi:hypothetical protein
VGESLSQPFRRATGIWRIDPAPTDRFTPWQETRNFLSPTWCGNRSCHRFRSNEVRLWLSVIAYNLGNLWRRLVLPKRVDKWSLTSLQQRLYRFHPDRFTLPT